MTRRSVLRGLGTCLALPWLESLAGARARAAAVKPPVRMAVLYMANGARQDAWTPQGKGSAFELSPILSPLAAHKDDLLVFSELWNAATNTGDGHYVKTGGFLTGTTITRTTGANLSSNGTSIDQLCAQRIGHFTPLPSLELGIEPPATGVDATVGYTQLYGAHIAWSTPHTPLPKELNPKLCFDRLFRPAAPAGDRAAAAARDASVLDAVLAETKRLQGRLGQEDQAKLGEYLESVRAVELRIEQDAKRQRATVLDDPLARAAIADLGRRVDPYSDPARVSERRGDHTEHVRLMLDLIALAFWTDQTRIATFMFGNAVSGRSFTFLGPGFGAHHQTSHHENKPEKLDQYQRINTWHIEHYAYLIEKLKSIREGEGTVLDNSMLLFGAGMRDGNSHNPHNLPIVLAGRGGGALATGRHLAYGTNQPLANLYRSMMAAMGAPADHFADSTGELAGLADPGFQGA
jgi:hypothetical protein